MMQSFFLHGVFVGHEHLDEPQIWEEPESLRCFDLSETNEAYPDQFPLHSLQNKNEMAIQHLGI